jgi:hypothetical protein
MYTTIIQKDFKFYVFETASEIRTSDHLQKYLSSKKEFIEKQEDFCLRDKEFRLRYSRPIELSLVPSNSIYGIHRKIGKTILDFDFKSYLNEKKLIIEKQPKLEYLVNNLFEHNLKIIADFFLTDVEKIKQGKLDIRLGMQKRLMFNINNK